jgi:hypothetical protein
MKDIKTTINVSHIEKLKVFFQANDLPGIVFSDYRIVISSDEKIDGIFVEKYHKAIIISYDENDNNTAGGITTLALKHLGVENMLVDYLNRLRTENIMVRTHIPPVIYEEKESFELFFKNKIKPQIGHI